MTAGLSAADPWPDDMILRLFEDLRQELTLEGGKQVPADKDYGAALWTVFSNNERVIDSNGQVVDVGSWRYAGNLIAMLCGGDYLDYYMSDYHADTALVSEISELLARKGFTLADWEVWEQGCLDGRYKIPSQWDDYFKRRREQRPQ